MRGYYKCNLKYNSGIVFKLKEKKESCVIKNLLN